MAKTGRGAVPPIGQDGQEEMTVMVLRIKGGGDTLRKGFDALNNALAALGQAQTLSTAPPARRLSAAVPAQGVVEDAEMDEGDSEEGSEDQATLDAGSSTGSNGKSRPRPKPKFLTTFDLNVSDKPWKEFAAGRSLKTEYEKYLLASLWITENAGKPEFTLGHVFTLFRAMKWNEQSDFSQPLRKMKSASSYFENPTSKTWKLTGLGLDAARAIPPA